jgi:circadian clock protein KaiC
MTMPKPPKAVRLAAPAKCPTGIRGLDDITEGGLPKGRPTLICGGAGCGKTLLAMEFLVRGIRDFKEAGVFMAFEENAEELAKNVASLGFDVPAMVRQKKLAIDYVHIERSEIEETGEYDLEGLFVRLDSMIKATGAKRVVLDSLEALFSGLPNEGILRAELRRLFRWLKAKGVTAVITAEQGKGAMTRHGMEEYVSDCVIMLDNRVVKQIATRRLRIVKYRGSKHGTNEYPTMIDEHGLSVLPISSLGLNYPVSDERVSSGIPRLDAMLGGKGYYRGTSILVSGTAGTGKSSMSAAFADATCKRGERCLYFSFEESPEQIKRNMTSIGFDLARWVKKGLLQFHSVRPSLCGLESHLVSMHNLVNTFKPAAMVIDPVTNLASLGDEGEIKAMLTRLIDFIKNQHISALFTSLTAGGAVPEQSEVGISSLMDSWLLLRMVESAGERNRLLYVLKSRGMAHSNQMREFVLSDRGIQLVDVYTGSGNVYTGSARLIQEAKDKAEGLTQQQAADCKQRELEAELASLSAQAEANSQRRESLRGELELAKKLERMQKQLAQAEQKGLASARKAD